MTKRGQQILAIFLIGLGVLYLAANFINIDPGDLFWPLALIGLGAVLIFRPKAIAPENTRHYFAGDVDLARDWQEGDQEVRMFAGDIDIDLLDLDLQPGENHYWVKFFAGDINVDVPEGIGLKVDSNGFVVDTKIDGEKVSNVMSGFQYESENYAAAEKKFVLHTAAFAVDLKIRFS